MPYCTAADVRRLVHTSLSDSDITSEIAISDALIDKRLGSQSSSDKVITKLSVLITVRAIKIRQPNSVVIGDYRDNQGNILDVLKADINEIFETYSGGFIVKGSDYRHIDEDTRYPEES